MKTGLRRLGVPGALLVVVGFAMSLFFWTLGWVSLNATLLPLVGLILCVVVGHLAPRSALAISLAAPFAPALPLLSVMGSRAEILGIVLALSAAVYARRSASQRAREVAARIVTPFALLSLLILFFLPHGSASVTSLGQAMAHAGAVAVAVVLLDLGPSHLARVFAPTGMAVGVMALTTPEMLTDRGISVVGGLNANGVGMVTAVGVVVAAVGVLHDRWAWRVVQLGVGTICVAGVTMSQSRGAYLDLAIAGLVVLTHRLIRRPTIRGRATLLAVLAFALYLGPVVVGWAGLMTGRFTEAQAESESLASRFEAVTYSVQVGVTHPLWGVGISNLAEYSSENKGLATVRSHVVYLGVLGEAGVAAFTLLAVLTWLGFSRSRDAGALPMAVAASSIVAGLSVNWWPSSGAGAVGLAVLAWAASLTGRQGDAAASPPPYVSQTVSSSPPRGSSTSRIGMVHDFHV